MKVRIMKNFISVMVLLAGAICSPQQRTVSSDRPSEPLKAYLRTYLNPGGMDSSDTTMRITAVSVKTDSGKIEEYIIYVSGEGWCGSGGCTMVVLEPAGSSFKVLGRVPAVQLPIRLLSSKHFGHSDIGVIVKGGATGYDAVLSFNGRRYPSNPSLPAARKRKAVGGQVIISGHNDGVPLYD